MTTLPRPLLAHALGALVVLDACSVPQDEFRSAGGTSPDPTATVPGTIVYAGPAPSCDYAGERATRVRGRVVLTLFSADDLPPPQGRAQSAENVMFVNASALFGLADCVTPDVPPEERATLTRAASFRWSLLALEDSAQSLVIRAFFDADEDMNPFFDVTRLPSAGDVVGGVLADPPGQGFAPIALPRRAEARQGFVADPVIARLGAVVHAERPMVALGAARALSAEAVLSPTLDLGVFEADPQVCIDAPGRCVARAALLEDVYALSCDAADAQCGLTLDALDGADVDAAFSAAGIAPERARQRRAFFTTPVDLRTVREGAPDRELPDGVPDPHPLLGASANVPWFSPITFLRRRALDAGQASRERAARIPEVLLVGSVLLGERGDAPSQGAYLGSLPVAVPPIALVDLAPERSDCRVPYVPPGNAKTAYETSAVHCGELPTGLYGVSVIGGVAGGERVDDESSDVGFAYAGAQLAGQSWSIPNELADPAQVGAEHALASQGEGALYVVHDPRPTRSGDCGQALDPLAVFLDEGATPRPVTLLPRCAPDESPALRESGTGVDVPACIPDACCAAVSHLCGLPLCPLCDDKICPELRAQGLNVRNGPTSIVQDGEGGPARPNCVPFELPRQCCE